MPLRTQWTLSAWELQEGRVRLEGVQGELDVREKAVQEARERAAESKQEARAAIERLQGELESAREEARSERDQRTGLKPVEVTQVSVLQAGAILARLRESFPEREWTRALASYLHDQSLVNEAWFREGVAAHGAGKLVEM